MVIRFFDSWKQSICPLRFQSPIVKDTKKGAQTWQEGTKQPIRQLKEQHYRTMTLQGLTGEKALEQEIKTE